jgi:hypothetical protein
MHFVSLLISGIAATEGRATKHQRELIDSIPFIANTAARLRLQPHGIYR